MSRKLKYDFSIQVTKQDALKYDQNENVFFYAGSNKRKLIC